MTHKAENRMKLNNEVRDGITILHFEGNMVFGEIEETEVAWKQIVQSRPKVLALNFTEVPHVDSAGMSKLVKLSRDALDNKVQLILYAMNENVRLLFKITTFDKFFTVMTDEEFLDFQQ